MRACRVTAFVVLEYEIALHVAQLVSLDLGLSVTGKPAAGKPRTAVALACFLWRWPPITDPNAHLVLCRQACGSSVVLLIFFCTVKFYVPIIKKRKSAAFGINC